MTDTLQNLENRLAQLVEEFNESLCDLFSQSLDSSFGGGPDPFDVAQDVRGEFMQQVANVAAEHAKNVDEEELAAMWRRLADMTEDHFGLAPTAQELSLTVENAAPMPVM